MVVVVVRYETTATARWALLFIVGAFFNDTITVALWTRFHCAPSVCGPASVCGTFSVCVRWSGLAQRMGPWTPLPRPLVARLAQRIAEGSSLADIAARLFFPLTLHKLRHALVIAVDPPHDKFRLLNKVSPRRLYR